MTGDQEALPVPPAKMSAAEVMARLRRHYLKPGELRPGGVFMPEVCRTFDGRVRRVDALYIGFFASRGHMIEGHEVKVHRQDWLKELDSPDKADGWFGHTHRWWVVAPEGVVRPEELPSGWGLLRPGKSKTRLDVVAPAAVRQPDIDFTLLFEIAKKLDTLRVNAVIDERDAARRDLEQRVQAEVERRLAVQQMDDETRRCVAIVQRMEESLGPISRWDLTSLDELGPRAAARALLTDAERIRRETERARHELVRLKGSMQHLIGTLDKTMQGFTPDD